MSAEASSGLLERLDAGPVICAEGYLFELERRGYVSAASYVPEVVLEHPEVVEALHREFVRAGSDVVEAFTYYAHREKLRAIGREADLEVMNRQALAIACKVARETGTLFSGDICNTNVFDPSDASTAVTVRRMFEEQLGWAADAGVDMIIVETFYFAQEALIAVQAARELGVPVVATLAVFDRGVMREGWSVADSCKRLKDAGADVVGMNCIRGPKTMLPLLREVRAAVPGHVAALPVPFRTHTSEPTMQSLTDPGYDALPGGRPYPTALEPLICNRHEVADFAREAYALGVRYLGLCCGAGPQHIRAITEALGRAAQSSRFTADMSKKTFVDAGDVAKH